MLLLTCKWSCDKQRGIWGTTTASFIEPRGDRWVPPGGAGHCWSQALASFACEFPAFRRRGGGGGCREWQRRIFSIQGWGPHSEHLSLTFLYLIVKLLWLEGCISSLSPFFQKWDLYPLFPTCKLLGPTWGWNGYHILQCWKSYWESATWPLVWKPWKVAKQPVI